MPRTLAAVLIAAALPLSACAAPSVPMPTLPPVAVPAKADTLAGRWTVTEVAGAVIPPGAPVWLQIGTGAVTGKSGCNSLSARVSGSGGNLKIGPTRATEMACDTGVMALESAFHAALRSVTRYEIASDGTLVFYGGDVPLMRALRQ